MWVDDDVQLAPHAALLWRVHVDCAIASVDRAVDWIALLPRGNKADNVSDKVYATFSYLGPLRDIYSIRDSLDQLGGCDDIQPIYAWIVRACVDLAKINRANVSCHVDGVLVFF
jgi:hypothetical protein